MSERIPLGGRRELGLINWGIARVGARTIHTARLHLFHILGRHKLLFLSFLPYNGLLLNGGKLSKHDKEVVILRVAHLRGSEYELQQHRRISKSRGLDSELQDKIFAGPSAEGLTDPERALLTAVDEFVLNRDLSDDAFAGLSAYMSYEQVIEFCALAGHYDALAAILAALRVPMDFPD